MASFIARCALYSRLTVPRASRTSRRAFRLPNSRAKNLATLRDWGLTDAQLALEGEHPTFGAVTLRQLLSTGVGVVMLTDSDRRRVYF